MQPPRARAGGGQDGNALSGADPDTDPKSVITYHSTCVRRRQVGWQARTMPAREREDEAPPGRRVFGRWGRVAEALDMQVRRSGF